MPETEQNYDRIHMLTDKQTESDSYIIPRFFNPVKSIYFTRISTNTINTKNKPVGNVAHDVALQAYVPPR